MGPILNAIREACRRAVNLMRRRPRVDHEANLEHRRASHGDHEVNLAPRRSLTVDHKALIQTSYRTWLTSRSMAGTDVIENRMVEVLMVYLHVNFAERAIETVHYESPTESYRDLESCLFIQLKFVGNAEVSHLVFVQERERHGLISLVSFTRRYPAQGASVVASVEGAGRAAAPAPALTSASASTVAVVAATGVTALTETATGAAPAAENEDETVTEDSAQLPMAALIDESPPIHEGAANTVEDVLRGEVELPGVPVATGAGAPVDVTENSFHAPAWVPTGPRPLSLRRGEDRTTSFDLSNEEILAAQLEPIFVTHFAATAPATAKQELTKNLLRYLRKNLSPRAVVTTAAAAGAGARRASVASHRAAAFTSSRRSPLVSPIRPTVRIPDTITVEKFALEPPLEG